MSIRKGAVSDKAPFQVGLRSLFLLMTAIATVSALGHYFGEIVLRCVAIVVLLVIIIAFVSLGPGLVTEVLTRIIDKSMVVIGAKRRALRKRLTVAANAVRQHDLAADSRRQ